MRCYFNLISDDQNFVDDKGVEVRDLDQARAQAMTAIEELRREDDLEADDWNRWTLEVTGASGDVLFTVRLTSLRH
jgi:hypothetical protein